jgi:hypothetical protein
MTAKRCFVFAAAFAFAGLTGSAAFAQEGPAEQTFYDLTAAWVAYERCNDIVFDQAQQAELNKAIMAKVGAQLGAGTKLSLVQSAKMKTSMRVATKGCAGNAPIEAALQTFQTDLAPAVGLAG